MNDQSAATPAPTPKPATHHKSRRTVRWIRRHQRALTFVGALIVFGTFVLKDALRERLKDLGDSIDKAEAVYVQRSNNQQIERAIEKMGQDIAIQNVAIVNAVAPNPKLEDLGINQQEAYSFIQGMETRINYTRLILDETTELARHLPRSSAMEFSNKLKNEEMGLAVWMKDYESFDPVAYITTGGNFDSYQQHKKLSIRLGSINRDVEKISSDVMKATRDTSARMEHGYDIATWASWFLYALGWGLGLVGRLVGVEGVSGGD